MARYDFATHRLHVEADLASGLMLALEREPMNYLLNVLRMQAGGKLLVFNGRHGEWQAELVQPSRKTAALKILIQTRKQDCATNIGYAFAPLKAARFDYLIQKAVEMGAACLTPVLTQRCQVSRLKTDRIRANAIEAAEQCGILTLPLIEPEIKLAAWLAALPEEHLVIFCDEDAEIADPLAALGRFPRGLAASVLIGPEGGFDERERGFLLKRRALCRLTLGPRILRADTAGVAAMALVQTVLGDWTRAPAAP